jgi:hypothetical protein
MIRFACPGCAVKLECSEDRLGQVISCPKCKQQLQLPKPTTPAPRAKATTIKPSSRPSLSLPAASPKTAPSIERGSNKLAWLAGSLLLVVLAGGAGGAVWWLKSQPSADPTDVSEKTSATGSASNGTSTASASGSSETAPPEWTPPAPSAPLSEPRIEEQVVVDSRGDAWITRAFQMPLRTYTMQKENTSNVALLERNLRLKQTWRQVEGLKATFDDRNSTLVVRWCVRGLARPQAAGSWLVPVADGLSVVHTTDNAVDLSGKTASDLGGPPVMRTSHVKLPAGAKNPSLRGLEGLAYDCPAPSSTAGDAAPRFDLEVRPHLLACLAQLYSKPRKFEQYWLARAVLRNAGKQTLKNYRVRFRVEGYTPDADEHRCAVIVPGQTVVDAAFPVLDLAKLATLTTPISGTLVAEYEYELPDGRPVREKVSRSLQILSRNMILTTDLRAEECINYQDQTRIFDHVLAAIATQKDTVIMTLNGWVNGWAAVLNKGRPVAASESADDALLYMRALHAFMRANLSYTTPPGEILDGKMSQHVKYGRDVLEHKAGTCIDLAILFASVCEAAGLEPILVGIPGHVFPAVKLPGGAMVGVETTRIGANDTFEDALMSGKKKLDSLRPGQFTLADVSRLRSQGLQGLPLPDKRLEDLRFVQRMPPIPVRIKLRDGSVVLVNLGGSSGPTGGGDATAGTGGGSPGPRPGGGGMVFPSAPPATLVSVVGRWQATGYEGRYFAKSDLSLGKDGKYTYSKVLFNNMGVPVGQVSQEGTYKTSRESIAFKNTSGDEEVCPYTMRGETLYLTIKSPMGTSYPQFRKVPE